MANEPVIITGMILKTKDGVIPLLTNSTPNPQAHTFFSLHIDPGTKELVQKEYKFPKPRKLWLEGSYAEEKAIHELDFPEPERYHP